MDDVERMYRQLVRIIRATSPQLLTQPFPVSDLYSTILPYRLHRRDLGLETNQDYELALLELLSGARGYLVVEDRMKQVLGDSLKSASPDPVLIREFGTARVSLAPDALRQLDGEGQPAASAPAAASAPTASTRRPSRPITVPSGGEECPHCKGELPAGRPINFCPHCGQDLTMRHCPACGSELEHEWKFCVTCGRAVGTG
jgi:hypothetical protein